MATFTIQTPKDLSPAEGDDHSSEVATFNLNREAGEGLWGASALPAVID